MNFTIHQGDNRETLKTLADNSVDAIITDPPYGIDFLGKTWDANTGALETYQECLRVLKPGGYILAFSAARTYHHLAITLEQAGFEIRDQLMWLYASGFPKAQDIGKAIDKRAGKGQEQTVRAEYNGGKHGSKSVDLSMVGTRCPVCKKDSNARYSCDKGDECGMIYKAQTPEAQQWAGWKTALKPAHEPICMARKPFKGSTIDNVLTHGLGALNIDATRIEWEPGEQEKEQLWRERYMAKNVGGPTFQETNIKEQRRGGLEADAPQGRFPSNVLGEVAGYQKYFYCPKVSRKERHCGFEAPPPEPFNSPEEMRKHPLWDPSIGTNSHRLMKKIREHQAKDPLGHIPTGNNFGDGLATGVDIMSKARGKHDPLGHIPTNPDGMLESSYKAGTPGQDYHDVRTNVGNNHPTVKPVALMRYLIKLVTPENSVVLDPFCGSGSTGMAAVELGHTFIGCELDPNYVRIAETRIRAWNTEPEPNNSFNEMFTKKD